MNIAKHHSRDGKESNSPIVNLSKNYHNDLYIKEKYSGKYDY